MKRDKKQSMGFFMSQGIPHLGGEIFNKGIENARGKSLKDS
jgi:hypothetical protein